MIYLKMSRMNAILSKIMRKPYAKGIIYNKYVLYIVFFIALINLHTYAVKQDYVYCILFILIGFITAFFNKNMTVILVIAMIFATIFNAILKGNPLHLEGFKNDQDVEDDMNELSNYIDSSRGKTTKLFGEETDEEPSSNKSAKSFSGNASPTPTKLMESLRENALDLQDTQKNIISGFQQIEPHMERAEELLETIQHTAETIKKMKDSQ
jgi:hypothetical protein